MISVDEATHIIARTIRSFGIEGVPIHQATGRVLKEDLVADRDFPPFHRVTMDGIAISYAAWEAGNRAFSIDQTATAGKPQVVMQDAERCIEVMTGAILPAGCDTVIRYEDTHISDRIARVMTESVEKGQNIHRRGEDRKAGDLIVKTGRRITAAETGVGATIGKSALQVARLPRVCLISSGDELVAVDETPMPHQIRRSNVYSVGSLLSGMRITCDMVHVPDEESGISRTLEQCLKDNDILILSGGISLGKYDFIPKVLAELGVRQHFHKVAQRPGKPFWFGEQPGGPVVFALPGNPVSTFVCTMRYILPWVHACLGDEHTPAARACLDAPVLFKPDLTYFLPVKLYWKNDGICYATPVGGHGSGDLANLVDADGFAELPSDRDRFESGECFSIWSYRTD